MHVKLHITILVLATAGATCGIVRTNTLVNGASNWNDPNSYTDTSFVPNSHEDVVIIQENSTVYLSSADTASFNIMSNLSYLCFTHTNSVLEITVPEGIDALFGCRFQGLWEYPKYSGQYFSGLIVKKGKGRITAGDGSKYPAGQNFVEYHRLPLRIEEGTWRCAQNIPDSSGMNLAYSTVHVAKDAVFCLASGNFQYESVLRLTGEGMVTTTGGATVQFRVLPVPEAKYGASGEFSGILDAGVKYFSSGRVALTGTNSLMTASPTVFGLSGGYATNSGYTAVIKFGNAGEPSSIGTNGTVDVNIRGGGWGYLGDGERTDKEFRWYPHQSTNGESYVSMLLDGGANGGLVFAGQWKPAREGIGAIVLTGSNDVPCVVDCPVQLNVTNPNSGWGVGAVSNFPVSIIKTGTGKWRFTHNKSRHLLGVFDIQQGTVQADSLEEAGVQSALGYATNMFLEGFANNVFQIPEIKRVTDYAFVLGAEASDSIAGVPTEGTFEYTGTNSAVCLTRPFVLDGDARLKNSTDHRFWIGKVRSRSAGVKTLTLDGDTANTNLVADITDAGGGVISLVKEGLGTWIVSGTNDIRGDIAVKAGTLILQNVNGQPHTWFKWQIRGKHTTSTTPSAATATIRTDEFGLFGADGERVNIGLKYCAEYQDLGFGQVAYATHRKRYGFVTVTGGTYSDVERLFDGSTGDAGVRIYYSTVAGNSDYGVVPQEECPDTWQTIMMRLDYGAKEVVSWDYADYFGLKGNDTQKQFNIKTSALYGSANGADWEWLDVAADVPMRNGYSLWAFDGRNAGGVHTNCNTIASRMQNVYPFLNNMTGTVSVAPGAMLVCQGAQITFSKLKLDAEGSGTIKNAAFAANGEISVVNVQSTLEIVFPGLFDGCETAANVARWSIRENGSITTRRRALVRGGDLRLVRKGICMSFK